MTESTRRRLFNQIMDSVLNRKNIEPNPPNASLVKDGRDILKKYLEDTDIKVNETDIAPALDFISEWEKRGVDVDLSEIDPKFDNGRNQAKRLASKFYQEVMKKGKDGDEERSALQELITFI